MLGPRALIIYYCCIIPVVLNDFVYVVYVLYIESHIIYNRRKPCVVCYVQTSGLSAEVTASSSADLAEIEQIVKDRMVNF